MTMTTIVDILYHVAPTTMMFVAIYCLRRGRRARRHRERQAS